VTEIQPRWFVVANVKQETTHGTGGADVQHGLKHFSGGTKVYLGLKMQLSVEVLGRHRGGARLVKLVLPARHLENFRVKLVYDPKVIAAARWFPKDTEESAKERAEWALQASKWGQPEAARAETQRAESGSAVNGTKVHTAKCGQDEV
jgi:hypothetical protein